VCIPRSHRVLSCLQSILWSRRHFLLLRNVKAAAVAVLSHKASELFNGPLQARQKSHINRSFSINGRGPRAQLNLHPSMHSWGDCILKTRTNLRSHTQRTILPPATSGPRPPAAGSAIISLPPPAGAAGKVYSCCAFAVAEARQKPARSRPESCEEAAQKTGEVGAQGPSTEQSAT